MLPLKHRPVWRVLDILVLIACLLAALLPFSSIFRSMGWLHLSDKQMHVVSFALLTVWFTGQYAKRSYWKLAVALALFGLLIELCQSLIGYRSAELFDLVADCIGIIAGLLVALIGLGGWSLKLETWFTRKASDA